MRTVLAVLVLTTGCAGMRERARCGDGRPGEVCRAAYEVLACSTKYVKIYESKAYWRATGCEREVHCDTVRREWVCEAAPSAEDRARAALAVRSGCKAPTLSILAVAPTPDGFGTYRVGGCGGPWLCVVTETTAECSPAEDWRPASDPSPTEAP